MFHFELWLMDNPECYRVSVAHARGAWFAKQVLIGLHAPVFIRQFAGDSGK